MSLTNYGDVHLFHRKMKLPHPKTPQLLDTDTLDFRVKFMQEELREFILANDLGNLPLAADALIDLVYVVMGTAVMMGLPWQALWDAVQYANIRKEPATAENDERSTRQHKLDVVKPAGWQPPDIQAVLNRYSRIAEQISQDGIEPDPVYYRPPVGPAE